MKLLNHDVTIARCLAFFCQFTLNITLYHAGDWGEAVASRFWEQLELQLSILMKLLNHDVTIARCLAFFRQFTLNITLYHAGDWGEAVASRFWEQLELQLSILLKLLSHDVTIAWCLGEDFFVNHFKFYFQSRRWLGRGSCHTVLGTIRTSIINPNEAFKSWRHNSAVLKGCVTRDNLQQRFFAQHRVNFSWYVKQVKFRATSYKMYLATWMLHETSFSASSTHNISHIRATRPQAMLNRILGMCCVKKSTVTLLHEPTFKIYVILRCKVLTWVQQLATCCRVKSCAKSRPRCSYFRATLLRKISLLQVVSCKTALNGSFFVHSVNVTFCRAGDWGRGSRLTVLGTIRTSIIKPYEAFKS